jgi:hypothetical protein
VTARLPRGWGAYFHPQAANRSGDGLRFVPGYRGTGQLPMARPQIQRYGGRVSGVPLTGGQAQGLVPASGLLTLLVGPQGLGTVWYPAQATISTTTGALDTSTALVYLGSGSVPSQLVATVYSGNGTAALAIPDMQPGDSLIVAWSGANPGDTAGVNIIGTMDALTTG